MCICGKHLSFGILIRYDSYFSDISLDKISCVIRVKELFPENDCKAVSHYLCDSLLTILLRFYRYLEQYLKVASRVFRRSSITFGGLAQMCFLPSMTSSFNNPSLQAAEQLDKQKNDPLI